MNTRKANLKKSGLFVLAAYSFLVAGIPAQAIDLNLDSSDFRVEQDGNPGAGYNSTLPSSKINTLSPENGFGNVFSEPFLLLGADPEDLNIPEDSRPKINSGATSKTFFLSEADVDPGANLEITFDWAFNGNATGNFNDRDNFNIILDKADDSDCALTCALIFERVVSGYGSNIGESVSISSSNFIGDFTEGDYLISISLNENLSSNSSAAGFDNITIKNNIPFEFSPGLGLLMAGGFWGVYYLLLKRRKVQLKADEAIAIWPEKLAAYRNEEAIASDPEKKFQPLQP